jgi:hypothetical protein
MINSPFLKIWMGWTRGYPYFFQHGFPKPVGFEDSFRPGWGDVKFGGWYRRSHGANYITHTQKGKTAASSQIRSNGMNKIPIPPCGAGCSLVNWGRLGVPEDSS